MNDEPRSLTGTDDEDDEDKESSSRGERRTTSPTRRPQTEVRLERKLKGGIVQLGAIVGRRDEELGNILAKDADKMSTTLTRWATSGPPPIKAAITILVPLLEPLDAFGATVAHLFRKLREARDVPDQEDELGEIKAEPWKVD